jgi:hypothetical protein
VDFLAARGIINGMGGGLFKPEANITRAQFVTILANLSGDDLSGYTTSSFAAVSTTTGTSQRTVGVRNGVALGSDGKFNPGANFTRQDIAVMLTRYRQNVAGFTFPS